MASKLYVTSMTVAELTSELKKRGLSCRGKKKTLQLRLEEALENEELSESSSEDEREATIRAASAVISQLDGDGSNNYKIDTTDNKEEMLVVSIEHSKRGLPINTASELSNGTELDKANKWGGDIDKGGGDIDNKGGGDADNKRGGDINNKRDGDIDNKGDGDIDNKKGGDIDSKGGGDIDNKKSGDIDNKGDGAISKQPPIIITPVTESVPEPQTTPIKLHPTSPEPQVTPIKSHPTSPKPNIVEVDVTTKQMSVPLLATPTETLPTTVTLLSPREVDIDSEVNSIAVEPPSPNRDDVSFVADEGNVSVCGSVELMDDTPLQEDRPIITKDSLTDVGEEPGKMSAATDDTVAMETDVDQPVVVKETRSVNIEGVSTAGDKVMSGSTDTGTVELDMVISTVGEDDMSAFSTEAAEVQKLDRENSACVSRPTSLVTSSGSTSDLVGGDVSNSATIKKRATPTSDEMSHDKESEIPNTKRRRISTSPKRIQERKRKWGSSVRTPTPSHTAISSDILENIIPEEVKEEVNMTISTSALDAVLSYGDDNVMEDNANNNGGTPIPVDNDRDTPTITDNKESLPPDDNVDTPTADITMEDDTKPTIEEDDILDFGKESSMVDEYEAEWKEKEREREEQRKESLKAKQELETRRRIEARVKARQTEREEIKDKPLVRRTPSPARQPPSRILHIKNLTRPFTNPQLKDLLQEEDCLLIEGGFWTDRIKSHCIAIYVTMEIAIAARNRIHNLKWPRQNHKLLKVDYLTTEEVSKCSNGELEIHPSSPLSAEEDADNSRVHETVLKETVNVTTDDTVTNENTVRTQTKDDEEDKSKEKPKSVLDNLFRKTKATPPIYWLPLSESEANKREQERKQIEIEREKRREERQKERDIEIMLREKKLNEEREERARERARRRDRSYSPRRRRTPLRRVRSPVRRRRSVSRSPVRRR